MWIQCGTSENSSAWLQFLGKVEFMLHRRTTWVRLSGEKKEQKLMNTSPKGTHGLTINRFGLSTAGSFYHRDLSEPCGNLSRKKTEKVIETSPTVAAHVHVLLTCARFPLITSPLFLPLLPKKKKEKKKGLTPSPSFFSDIRYCQQLEEEEKASQARL